jgi:DNA polymerase III alpha subunit (gram-positive type)
LVPFSVFLPFRNEKRSDVQKGISSSSNRNLQLDRISTFPPKDETLDHMEKIIARHTESELQPDGEKRHRDIILVAHDIQADEKFLAKIGFDLRRVNITLKVDTKEMHQHYRKFSQGLSLSHTLTDFGIHHQHLHNAGNDANYTLKAAIACGFAYAQHQAETLARDKKTEEKI